MQYDAAVPQPPDIPSTDSQDQFITNFNYFNTFWGVNHVPFGNLITEATQAAPCVCTSPNHGLAPGNSITPTHMTGTLNGNIVSWNTNNVTAAITVIDENKFSINGSDTTLMPPYNGLTDTNLPSGDFSSSNFLYGYHTGVNFSTNGSAPNLVPPRASLFPQLFSELTQMVWQNDNLELNNPQLTGATIQQSTDPTNATPRYGMRTPWGLIVNWGFPTINRNQPSPNSFLATYEIPFVNPPLSILCTGNFSDTRNYMFVSTVPGAVTNTNFYFGFNSSFSPGGPNANSGVYFAIGV